MELGELPAGWESAELSEICLVNPTIDKSAIADDLAVSFVPMPAVEAENGAVDVSATRKFGEVKKGYTPFREGDVLFAKITPCMENGKMAVVPALHNGLGFGSTEFHVLRAHPGINPQFVYYFVSSRAFRHVAEHNMSGAVGQRRVTTPYLSACKIPVPPTAEQHRIVAKIEELFSELDQGVPSLKTAREQLKVYRQSLLKNAFEGKLTAAWRAAHPDQLETAAALQQRITRERQARYQQQLADWQAAGQPGPKPKPPKLLPPLTAEELAELPELPAGWRWLRIDEVVADSMIGLDRGAKDQTQEPPGIPYVKMNNVSMDGHVFTDKLVFIQASIAELNKFALEEGDILFNTRNSRELVGKSGIVRKLHRPTVYNNNLMRIRVSQSVDHLFLSLQMTGGNFKKALERAKKGTTNVAAVYAKDFFPLPVAVACSNEQKQVVEILEAKLSEADQLDQTLATALQQADALRQSILKKAFSGQLVKQDKTDEPATALLERIRTSRHISVKRSSRSSSI